MCFAFVVDKKERIFKKNIIEQRHSKQNLNFLIRIKKPAYSIINDFLFKDYLFIFKKCEKKGSIRIEITRPEQTKKAKKEQNRHKTSHHRFLKPLLTFEQRKRESERKREKGCSSLGPHLNTITST